MFFRISKEVQAEKFEAAALPHLNDMFRTAVRLTENQAEAEDLVQEVYLQAWKSFHHFRLGTNCRAWLFRILFNKFDHYNRKKFKSKLVEISEDFIQETVVYEAPVSPHLCDEEIISALHTLPECYRQVIILADIQEYSYKEIAGILKIPLGTVMSRLNRGRKLLRACLADASKAYRITNGGDVTKQSSLARGSSQ